jgi:hypothetical protein
LVRPVNKVSVFDFSNELDAAGALFGFEETVVCGLVARAGALLGCLVAGWEEEEDLLEGGNGAEGRATSWKLFVFADDCPTPEPELPPELVADFFKLTGPSVDGLYK